MGLMLTGAQRQRRRGRRHEDILDKENSRKGLGGMKAGMALEFKENKRRESAWEAGVRSWMTSEVMPRSPKEFSSQCARSLVRALLPRADPEKVVPQEAICHPHFSLSNG